MANIINKLTFQIIRSANTPKFQNGDWYINPPNLSEIESTPKKYLKDNGEMVVEMGDDEKAVVDLSNLPALKEAKKQEINTRTKQGITEGFTFDSSVFSFDIHDQINYAALYDGRDNTDVVKYNQESPYNPSISGFIMILENDDLFIFEDSIDIRDFYYAGFAHKKNWLLSGGYLKAQVMAVTSVDDLNAITDTR